MPIKCDDCGKITDRGYPDGIKNLCFDCFSIKCKKEYENKIGKKEIIEKGKKDIPKIGLNGKIKRGNMNEIY